MKMQGRNERLSLYTGSDTEAVFSCEVWIWTKLLAGRRMVWYHGY